MGAQGGSTRPNAPLSSEKQAPSSDIEARVAELERIVGSHLAALGDRLAVLESLGRALDDARAENTARGLTHAGIWPTTVGGRRPKFWSDLPVRTFAVSSYRQMTLDEACAEALERFGARRAPTRSSLHRFWQRLDKLRGRA